jgi:hypothetical protein
MFLKSIGLGFLTIGGSFSFLYSFEEKKRKITKIVIFAANNLQLIKRDNEYN